MVVRSTAGASAGAAGCGSSEAVAAGADADRTGSALATCVPATGARAERPTVPDCTGAEAVIGAAEAPSSAGKGWSPGGIICRWLVVAVKTLSMPPNREALELQPAASPPITTSAAPRASLR